MLVGAGTTCIMGLAGCGTQSTVSYAGREDATTAWWPQPQYGSYETCYNPETTVTPDEPSVRWEIEIASPAARPVVVDGVAVLPTADGVRALSVTDGTELWRTGVNGSSQYPQSVTTHDGVVFISRVESPEIIAVDLHSGTQQWKLSLDLLPVALTISRRGPALYVGFTDGRIYKLNPTTGETIWKQELFGAISTLVVAESTCLVGTEGGAVYALSSHDGQGIWRRKFPGMISALGSLWGSSNGATHFVSCFGGPVYGVGEITGATVWQSDDVWSDESLVITKDRLFAAGESLTAISTDGGTQSWTAGTTTQCGPAGAGELVFVATETSIDAYKMGGGAGVGGIRFGPTQWSQPVEGRPEQGIAIADGAVFVMTMGIDGDRSMAYAIE